MTGHNDKSNTLSLVAFCCLCTILSFSLWASIQIKCHVCFCGEWKFVLSEFCKLVSTCCAALTCEGLFCLYVVIFTDVFGLRWCFLWVCVFAVFYTCVLSPFRCCCCNGAQQGRGATLCESDRTIFTPPHVSFTCSSCSLYFLRMSCFSWFNLCNYIISLFFQDLSFHYLWLYMYICLCVRELYSRIYFGPPSFCILWTASLTTAFTFGL